MSIALCAPWPRAAALGLGYPAFVGPMGDALGLPEPVRDLSPLLALLLGAFLIVVGVTHFVLPTHYLRLVPPWLPKARALVLVSGVCEIAIGAALWIEPTRTLAGWAAAALLGIYVLTHLEALFRASADNESWLLRPAGALARVVVNLAYLAWALAVAAG